MTEATAAPWAPLNADEAFYVTIKRDSRSGCLLGPYRTHQEALDRVDDARELAIELDRFAAFDAFGTTRARRGPSARPFPAGRLNDLWTERHDTAQPE